MLKAYGKDFTPQTLVDTCELVQLDHSRGFISEREAKAILAQQSRDGKEVMNACFLDFLLENPELIPETWRKKNERGEAVFVIFWGTTYVVSGGFLMVRGLVFDEKAGWEEIRLPSNCGMSNLNITVTIPFVRPW